MKSQLMPEYEAGFDAIMENAENIVCRITGDMTFFPLCCSTGVIKSVTAKHPTANERLAFERNEAITGAEINKVKEAKYIFQITRAIDCASRPIFFPLKVARWNALSLILAKCVEGLDDGPSGGYNNYKAAQIVMCDRLVADKRNPKFNFSHYNVVFSVDQLMDWLEEHNGSLGDMQVSPPRPGGHGARVRAGIFTPNLDALQKAHDKHIESVREHVMACLTDKTVKEAAAVDKVAASW